MFSGLSDSRSISSPAASGDRAAAGERPQREARVLLAVGLALLVLSGIHPRDRHVDSRGRAGLRGGPRARGHGPPVPLTPLAYRLIFIHALILMAGGHYTYTEVPLGFRVRDLFGLARNHYDRLGHFAQGFVPAILARLEAARPPL
ncbi:MAG TPA: DUF2238 domain-containing protein [Thermoanaerobaculia bacterium]|nr:DUF2238 domain-containing protein [Thermoanaerobaculia bacterium]